MLLFVLKPSRIDVGGIGVFATEHIRSGTVLPLFSPKDYGFLRHAVIKKLPPQVRLFIKTHGVKDTTGYHLAEDLNRMSVGWYLNHSEAPNVEHHNYRYSARRVIRAGEELTIDYRTLGEENAERFVRRHCRG